MVTLAIIGKSGYGKTALMSKLACKVFDEQKDANIPVIIRYCGTSPESATGQGVILSIIRHILCIYPDALPDTSAWYNQGSFSYADTVKCFKKLLNTCPVYLFIDSLDQLSDENQARSELNFLRDFQIHERSRLVVSSLPDEKDSDGTWKYCYRCDKCLKEMGVPRLEMKGIEDESELELILAGLLGRRNQRRGDGNQCP